MMNQSTWQIIAIAWMVIAIITFISLFFKNITAPFGRHTRSDWGPMINNSLGWIIMEVPSLTLLWVGFLMFANEQTPVWAYLPMALWSIHYIHRSFIYPFRLKNKKKQMPLVITFSAIAFNLVNGFLNGLFLAKGWFLISIPLIIVGLVIFATGMYINLKSDTMLINLRKPGETGYKIPSGFLFDKVSSPNLYGELIEWLGFVIISPSLASLSFWVWSLANLVPRARDHHKWYLKKFDNYPKERKVLIPNIW